MSLIPVVVAVLVAQVDAGASAPVDVVDAGVPTVMAPVDAGTPAPAVEPKLVRVTMKDGQVVTGALLEKRADGSVLLELGSGARLDLPKASIVELEADTRSYTSGGGETWFLDPNRTRYLYGPSAMMLKKNEVYFSQLELLASTVNWGVTDWLGVQAGAAVPLWFAEIPRSFHLLLAAKVGTEVAPKVHLAAGLQALWVPLMPVDPNGYPLLGLAFGTATYGDADRHVSLSAAVPVNLVGNRANFVAWLGNPLFTLSGNYRLTRGLALVSENWLFLPTGSPENFGVINAAAARVMGEHIAADLGLFLVWNRSGLWAPIPLPWIGFTYNFS